MTQAKRPRNMLSAKEVFRLNNWCLSNKDNFIGKTRERIAQEASSALDLRVTAGNITGALKVCDITLSPSLKAGSTTDRVQVLARELENLFIALDHLVPEAVHSIATRKKAS